MNFNKRNTYDIINQSSILGSTGPGGEDFGNIPRCRQDPPNIPGAGGLTRQQPSELPGGASRDDCNSIKIKFTQDDINQLGTDTTAKRKAFVKDECESLYFNDPWVGVPKICDGEPYQNWWNKGKFGSWNCAPKTECRFPQS